jgi:hypothetical protein
MVSRVRDASSGSRIWPVVLAAALAFVAADFARYPFIGAGEGRAAAPARDLTVFLPVGDARSPFAADARVLAGALGERGHSARAARGEAGAARTVLEFAERGEVDGGRLLLFSSSSLAEILRGVHQPASGDESAEALAALDALSRLQPVAGVSADRTVVAVSAGSGRATFASVAVRMRSDPRSRVAGIGADAASKAALAGMVSSLGVDGEVPYRVYPSGADATLALASGDVDLVVAPRSETLAERRRGEVRLLEAPLAPAWSVLLAPPSIDSAVRRVLAHRVDRALTRPAWRRHAARHGIARLRPGASGLRAFLATRQARAARVAALAARVPEQRKEAL